MNRLKQKLKDGHPNSKKRLLSLLIEHQILVEQIPFLKDMDGPWDYGKRSKHVNFFRVNSYAVHFSGVQVVPENCNSIFHCR